MTTAPSVSASASATSSAAMTPAMELALSSNFPSVARWREEFMALAAAHRNEPGRVELAFMADDGSLLNRWVPSGAGSDAATAMRLRARGVNARFLDGGIDAWQRAGLRTVPKGGTS